MRIIVITNRFGDIGTHPQLTRVALHLRNTGHEVRAISLAPPGTIVEMFGKAGIHTTVINARRKGSFLPVIARLSATFRQVRPDVVVAFLYEAIMPTRLAARLARVPAVVSSIRNEYFGARYRELLLRATERLSAATVVNSQRVADSLVTRGIMSSDHVVVIHNGIDVSTFERSESRREATRRHFGLSEREFMWLTVGRLEEQKAYPDLLQAFSLVVETMPRSRLIITGRGRMRGELEALARRLGLRDTVAFVGFREDIPSLLSAADAFVIASRYEGMPNALIEALAAGLPAVATEVGGIPELIEAGVTGYVVPPSEPHALADAMTRLAQTPMRQRIEMGNRGRTVVRELCDMSKVMESWASVVHNAMLQSRSR